MGHQHNDIWLNFQTSIQMMDREMKQIDAMFGNMLKVPSFFGNNIFDRIFSNQIENSEVIEEMEASGDDNNPLFFF